MARSIKRRFLPCAFVGSALAIYVLVAADILQASAYELCTLLETRLCSARHRQALRFKFNTLRWRDRKETVKEFDTLVRSAALALPESILEGILLDRAISAFKYAKPGFIDLRNV